MTLVLYIILTVIVALMAGWFAGHSAAMKQLSPMINRLFDQIEELEKERTL